MKNYTYLEIQTSATILDNTGPHSSYDNSFVTVDVDQEGNHSFSNRGSRVCPISLTASDLKKAETISFATSNLSTGCSDLIWANFIESNDYYTLICSTSTTSVLVNLGRLYSGLLKENKFGKLADLGTIVYIAVYETTSTSYGCPSRDDKIKLAQREMKKNVFKRKNQKS